MSFLLIYFCKKFIKFHTLFRRYSLRSSVNPPKPHDVKKFMANLVLAGLFRGNRPSNDTANVESRSLSFSFDRDILSASSCKLCLKILI